MPVIYSATLKTTRMQAVVTALGSGAKLVLGTSALSGATGVLATEVLPATAGTVSGNVLTLSGTPLSVASAAVGSLAKAELRTSADVVVVSGLTVGTSASDIIVDTTTISSVGQIVNINSGTLTHG
jgi:hypothetical protein